MDLSLKPSTTVRNVKCASLGNIVADRISSLPDELLIRIISMLPTKYAAATGVLSKRWTHLFAWITSLEFDDSPISHCVKNPKHAHLMDRFTSFKSFVCRVLQSCKSENLNRFTLRIGRTEPLSVAFHCCATAPCYPDLKPMQLDAWIHFPLWHSVRELDLEFIVKNPGELPPEIFTSETLEVLRIRANLNFDPPFPLSSFCLPNLKVFHLLNLKIPSHLNDFLTALLSGSPLLEDLHVSYTVWARHHREIINISSTSLRRLTLKFLHESDAEDLCREVLVLDTPNLCYFSYKDNILARHYSIREMNALIEADIHIYSGFRKDMEVESLTMLDLLNVFSNVRRLSLLGMCVQILHNGGPEDKLPLFHNLSCLHLGFDPCNQWDKVLLEMLKCSPSLVTLTFPQGLSGLGEGRDRAEVVEMESQCWSTTREIPSCFRSNLKRIIIRPFLGSERDFNLINFLLSNALVLEELCIFGYRSIEDKVCAGRRLTELPRASHKCLINLRFD